ncbi:MAG TPA: NYN domain-containing protein [Smithella sp.]|nr:NYN domain-containing protein [Smithella sp.]HRS97784.1 NYN domain-containing protein [Smithella sp.]
MMMIIDGYNLIRQSDALRRHEHKSLENGRRALLTWLADYEKIKHHKIIVVFDGWKSGSPDEQRDREGNIDVIYSRYGERADDVIKRLTQNAPGDVVVVSSDREISSRATRLGKTPLSSPEFESIVNRTLRGIPSAAIITARQETNATRQAKKKGPSRKLPRAQRRAQSKIEKL